MKELKPSSAAAARTGPTRNDYIRLAHREAENLRVMTYRRDNAPRSKPRSARLEEAAGEYSQSGVAAPGSARAGAVGLAVRPGDERNQFPDFRSHSPAKSLPWLFGILVAPPSPRGVGMTRDTPNASDDASGVIKTALAAHSVRLGRRRRRHQDERHSSHSSPRIRTLSRRMPPRRIARRHDYLLIGRRAAQRSRRMHSERKTHGVEKQWH